VGYEVLGSESVGSDGDDARSAGSPARIVPFDDLPDPGSVLRSTPGRARPGSTAPARPGRGAPTRSGWAVLVVATLAAGLVGAAVTGARATDRAQERRAAERRATLAVVVLATAGSVRMTSQGIAVEVAVAVFNRGPEAVTLIESPDRPAPVLGRAAVELVSGPGQITPDRPTVATVRVLLDCSTDEPLQVRVPVRTNDGRVHPVEAVEGGANLFGLSSRRLCPGTQSARLEARLTGTPGRPALLLGNDSAVRITVALDSGSGFTQTSSGFFSLTTRPALPLVLRPGQRRELALALDVRRCFTGQADQATSRLGVAGLGVIGLRYQRVDRPWAQAQDVAGATTVDLTPVFVATSRRTCR
jgi:hypothetical protein